VSDSVQQQIKEEFTMLARIGLAVLAFTFSAVVLAKNIAKEYPVKDFSEFVATSGIEVEISQTGEEYLRIEADESLFDKIKVDQTGKKVSIWVKHNWSISDWFEDDDSGQIKVILNVKNLNYLDISGAVQAKVGDLKADTFYLNASGASQGDFSTLNATNLKVDLSGAANARFQTLNSKEQYFGLSGAANMDVKSHSNTELLKANASGASNMRARKLIAKSADLEASGASHIDLAVTEQLNAEASGASGINYYGNPKAHRDASGASHINAHSND
jgi:Putative auto-transporter adhesin, head GIN domain